MSIVWTSVFGISDPFLPLLVSAPLSCSVLSSHFWISSFNIPHSARHAYIQFQHLGLVPVVDLSRFPKFLLCELMLILPCLAFDICSNYFESPVYVNSFVWVGVEFFFFNNIFPSLRVSYIYRFMLRPPSTTNCPIFPLTQLHPSGAPPSCSF